MSPTARSWCRDSTASPWRACGAWRRWWTTSARRWTSTSDHTGSAPPPRVRAGIPVVRRGSRVQRMTHPRPASVILARGRTGRAAAPRTRGCGPGACAGVPTGSGEARAARRGRGGSDVADADDLVGARAAGHDDLDGVALVLADQRPRHRRGHRNPPLLDVSLQLADDLVGDGRFVVVQVHQLDGGTEHDARTRRDLGRIDHLRVRQRGFELLDAALDETLLLAGGVVFGVLAQVAMRARLGDGVDHRRALDRLQFFKLRTQALRAAHSQGNP